MRRFAPFAPARVCWKKRRLAPGNLDVELQLAQTHQQVGSVLLNNKGRNAEALAALKQAVAIGEPVARRVPRTSSPKSN